MYTVHMKRVTATEARKSWFRLLDEAAGGEVIVIEREGARLILQRSSGDEGKARVPSYEGLIRIRDVDKADRWGWEWTGSEGELVPRIVEPES